MSVLEQIRKWSEKTTYTAKEKEKISKLAAENNISLNPLCPDCYRDAVIQLYSIYKPKDELQDAGGYELRDGLDVTWVSSRHGEFRICAATCNAENAKKWLAAGVPSRFFKRMPQDGCNE